MTFRDYLVQANQFYLQNRREQRKGQCYWQVLLECNQDLADSISDTKLNPFEFDHRLENFLDYVKDHWYDGD